MSNNPSSQALCLLRGFKQALTSMPLQRNPKIMQEAVGTGASEALPLDGALHALASTFQKEPQPQNGKMGKYPSSQALCLLRGFKQALTSMPFQ